MAIPKLGETYAVKDPVDGKWLIMRALRRTPAYTCPAPAEPGTLFAAVSDEMNRINVPRNFYATSVEDFCETCGGEGGVETAHPSGDPQRSVTGPCPDCHVRDEDYEPDYEAMAEARGLRRGIGEEYR